MYTTYTADINNCQEKKYDDRACFS